jgi:hypothetical protein
MKYEGARTHGGTAARGLPCSLEELEHRRKS